MLFDIWIFFLNVFIKYYYLDLPKKRIDTLIAATTIEVRGKIVDEDRMKIDDTKIATVAVKTGVSITDLPNIIVGEVVEVAIPSMSMMIDIVGEKQTEMIVVVVVLEVKKAEGKMRKYMATVVLVVLVDVLIAVSVITMTMLNMLITRESGIIGIMTSE